jgi:hypothetical protein
MDLKFPLYMTVLGGSAMGLLLTCSPNYHAKLFHDETAQMVSSHQSKLVMQSGGVIWLSYAALIFCVVKYGDVRLQTKALLVETLSSIAAVIQYGIGFRSKLHKESRNVNDLLYGGAAIVAFGCSFILGKKGVF